MFNVIKKLFGTKYDRDVKAYQGQVDKTNEYFRSYASLSHDELRNKTVEFRTRIKDHLSGIDVDMESARASANDETDLLAKEDLYNAIDKLQEERDKHQEEILQELLPEAFAVVKETARRFMENTTLEVSATDHDREIAATKKETGKLLLHKCEEKGHTHVFLLSLSVCYGVSLNNFLQHYKENYKYTMK